MDSSISSLQNEGHPEAEHRLEQEQAYRRDTLKRLIVILLSTVIFIATVVVALLGILLPVKPSRAPLPTNHSARGENDNHNHNYNLGEICNVTRYSDSCVSSIASLLNGSNNPDPDLVEIFLLSMRVSVDEMTKLSETLERLASSEECGGHPLVKGALDKCRTLLRSAVGLVNESISSVRASREGKTGCRIDEVRKWLGKAVKYQMECFAGVNKVAKHGVMAPLFESAVGNSTKFTNNCLAIASNIDCVSEQHL